MTEEIEDFVEEAAYDAADPRTVNSARKRDARLRMKRINFVRQMMNCEEGRLWVYDLLIMGHMAEPVHTPGDPYATAFKDGERNLANKILYDINEGAPEMYMKMLTDGKAEK